MGRCTSIPNPFQVGDLVRVEGGGNLSRLGVEGTVVRIINPRYIEIDVGLDPLFAGRVTIVNNEPVKFKMPIEVVKKL